MYTAGEIQVLMRSINKNEVEIRGDIIEADRRIVLEVFRQAFPEATEIKIRSDYFDFNYYITLVGIFLTSEVKIKGFWMPIPQEVRWRPSRHPDGIKVQISAHDLCEHLADESLTTIIQFLQVMTIREEVIEALLKCMRETDCEVEEAVRAFGNLLRPVPTETECIEASLRSPYKIADLKRA